MSYIGKQFVLDSQENFEEFLDSLGEGKLPPEIQKVLINHKATTKLLKNGEEFTLISSKPTGGEREVTFKNGVEIDDDIAGNKAKAVYTMSGDTLTSVMNFENGTKLTMKREFSDNELVVTVESSTGAHCKRFYKA